MALTKKRLKFCDEFLIDFNQTKAAERAGYSKRSARNQGYRLMRNEEVREEINRRMDKHALEGEEVLARLGQMARGVMPTKIVKRGRKVAEHFDAESALEKVGRASALFIDRHIFNLDELEIIDDDE